MIAQLCGEIVNKDRNSIIIDVNGVGYEVQMSELDIDQCQLHETLKISTHLAVRENAQDLYGFINPAAKSLFGLLTSVSGVGPKVALSILGLGEPQNISSAIAQGNTTYITGASGVGKRVAEKIIVELKDKVGAASVDTEELGVGSSQDDAYAALLSLGYSSSQATQALSGLDGSVEERIKNALKVLS